MSDVLAAPFDIDCSVGRQERGWLAVGVAAAALGIVLADLPWLAALGLALLLAALAVRHARVEQRRAQLRMRLYADGLVALVRGDHPPEPAELAQVQRLLGIPVIDLRCGRERYALTLFSDRLNAGQDHRLRLWLATHPAERQTPP